MKFTIGLKDDEIHNFFLAPNICFDYYPINTPTQIEFDPDYLDEKPQTGFIDIDNGQISLVKKDSGKSIIGVWLSNLPECENEIRSPYLWAACARMILCEENF